FAVLLAFNSVVWLAAAALREGRYGQLEPLAVTSYLAGALLVLFTGLVVARIYRDPAAALVVAVALMASDLVLELSGTALVMLAPPQWAGAVYAAFIAWIWVVSVRAVAVCAGTRRPQLYLGALAASALIAVMLYVFPRSDVWAPGEAPAAPALADERVFQLQGELLARALDSLAPGAAGETELYFIGFAPDGSQDVFLREMRYVKRLVEERYAAGRRSLVLANGDGALREFPVASATSLRKALAQVGARMNADEDVLLLYLSAHGDRNFELSARQPPLVLATLNPTALARMLQDSAIRWKVVIVSACHAGGFIEPLKDANTLVIAAARADRTSFGCAHGRDFTYFGRAFFRDALAQTRSFAQAFETARNIVAQQEKAEGLEPSEPQMWVGEAIAERLKPLER
ncbi:MAG: C13 family peptidase, partial [Burkholderiales bacterium]